MNRAFTSLLVDSVGQSARFYESLLGMTRHFDSDWFVILTHPGISQLEFGLLDRNNEIVPQEGRMAPQGIIQTFVVDDTDAVFETAKSMDAVIVEPPRDMPYGQRRMLLRDPDGTLIDISAPTAPPPA